MIMLMVSSLLLPGEAFAKEFPSSITNIYELRDYDETTGTGSLAGYFGTYPTRLMAGGYHQHGYYLGTNTQFLPYKVGNATVRENNSVSEYEFAVYCTMFGDASPAHNSYSGICKNATAHFYICRNILSADFIVVVT